jgi:hypothetical protein
VHVDLPKRPFLVFIRSGGSLVPLQQQNFVDPSSFDLRCNDDQTSLTTNDTQ